jgi:hypothetical protein
VVQTGGDLIHCGSSQLAATSISIGEEHQLSIIEKHNKFLRNAHQSPCTAPRLGVDGAGGPWSGLLRREGGVEEWNVGSTFVDEDFEANDD